MKVLVCGVPGTGKTSIGLSLSLESFHYINLNTFAYLTNSFLDYDPVRQSYILNVNKLEKKFKKILKIFSKVIIDSHVVECIPKDLDLIIILRCDPFLLFNRLKKKYNMKKIIGNVEAEFSNVIPFECENHFSNNKIVEIKSNSLAKATHIIKRLIAEPSIHKRKRIDWIEVYERKKLIEKYFELISSTIL